MVLANTPALAERPIVQLNAQSKLLAGVEEYRERAKGFDEYPGPLSL